MKTKRSFLVVSLFSIFILASFLMAQFEKTIEPAQDFKGLITIKGYVYYGIGKDIQSSNVLDSELMVLLRTRDKFKIVSVKLNGIKYKSIQNPDEYNYQVYKSGFNTSLGKLLELKVGIAKKVGITLIKNVKYYTVATFKVNNLYKKFIFPKPDQVINLASDSNKSIVLRWKFTNFVQKSVISIRPWFAATPSIYTSAAGESCSILKSDLDYDKKYRLNIGTHEKLRSKTGFKFTKLVRRGSGLNFFHGYSINFSTNKRLIRRGR